MAHPLFSSTILNHKEQNETSYLIELLTKVVQIFEEKNQSDSKALVLTVKDAATKLQVSIPSLRDHFLCRPDFPKIKVGTKILIPRKALEDWVNAEN